jgi:hypothetical protein
VAMNEGKHAPYAGAIIKLLQGVLYPDDSAWESLLTYETEIRDYFARIGVKLEMLKGEYAFLTQPRPVESEDGNDAQEAPPRLMRTQRLTYHTTLLCVLLRERLIEHEAEQEPGLPTITREILYERMLPLLKERNRESVVRKKIDAAISDAVEMGYIKELESKTLYQIRGVLKARMSAEKLAEIRARLIYKEEEAPDASE